MQFKTTAKYTLYLPSAAPITYVSVAGIDVDHEYYVQMPLVRYHLAVPIILLYWWTYSYWIRCRLKGLCESECVCVCAPERYRSNATTNLSGPHKSHLKVFHFIFICHCIRCGLQSMDGIYICTVPSGRRCSKKKMVEEKNISLRLNEWINTY